MSYQFEENSQLSPEFIEKYKLCPVTNKVLLMLNNGINPLTVIEQILTMYEDLSLEVTKERIDEIERSQIKTFECYKCHAVNPIRTKAK